MGKALYEQNMKRRIQDLRFAMNGIRRRLRDGVDDRVKLDLTVQLTELDFRRRQMEEKLHRLETEPPGTWANLKSEIDEEWNVLVQDFEERIGGLT